MLIKKVSKTIHKIHTFHKMTNEHRYSLEKGSRKHICPECSKKRFVRYIDKETNEYLPAQYGRCDRESKCAYHLNPYLDGYAKMKRGREQGNNRLPRHRFKPKPKTIKPKSEPVFFDFDTFKKTLSSKLYQQNTFIQNLLSNVAFPFEVDEVTKIIQLYRLGTVASGYRAGAITLPFIDIKNNVRTIQVKQFDKTNHTIATDFLHSILERYYNKNSSPLPKWLAAYIKQDKRVSCLFGEHLISKYPLNPIALVEAPKTAIYATLYFGFPDNPDNLIWLAVYNKSSFSIDKLKVLRGRDIYTFPDLSKDGNTFNEWQEKAKTIEGKLPGTKFIFSDLLEQLAPESDRFNGNDLADYLIKQDWRLFRKQPIQPIILSEVEGSLTPIREKSEKNETLKEPFIFPSVPQKDNSLNIERTNRNEQSNKESWLSEIIKLENFFNSVQLPTELINLNPFSTISNIPLFIESHLCIVKAQNGIRAYLPYLDRLKKLKKALTSIN